MKKLIYILIFIFIFMFIDVNGVNAANLDMKDLTLECIYSDGGLYTSSYNEDDDKFVVNRTTYNMDGVNNNSSNRGSASRILNGMSVSGGKCNPDLYYAKVKYESNNDENNNQKDITVDYYQFGKRITADDVGVSNTWTDYLNPTANGNADKVNDAPNEKYKLLSERYILNSGAPESNTTVYYVQEAEQAAGTNSYIAIHVYDNTILLEKDDRITRLDGNVDIFKGITRDKDRKLSKNVPKEIYINSPEPKVNTNSSSNIVYKFLKSQKIYSFTESGDSTHIYKYTLTDDIKDPNQSTDDDLCNEILPNTSKVLKDVIKFTQILVPVFLIILTGLDIGKIVLTGNIDEELPKRKKIIVVRFVIVVVFFLLPVFVRVFISRLRDTGAENTDRIKYIDCLFK